MSDPYKVLGISRDATDEQVKEAYREMAKKYHPDNYQGSPIADLANEKMKEVNEAYDQIMNERKNRKTVEVLHRVTAADIIQITVTQTPILLMFVI